MDRSALFIFGCVMFFTVATGGFLYLMMSFAELANQGRDEVKPPSETVSSARSSGGISL
jgi:hypothetical protein